MTPEERADEAVRLVADLDRTRPLVYLVNQPTTIGKSYGDVHADIRVIKKAIADCIRSAVREALLEQSQVAYSMGLALNAKDEAALIQDLFDAIEAGSSHIAPYQRTAFWKETDRKQLALQEQLRTYRHLIATMAKDNGYQDGFEAGKRFVEAQR